MLRVLSYIVFVLLISGCCQAECVGAYVQVSFERYKATETDSVLVVRYRPGTNFSVRIDSNWTYTPVPVTDTSHSLLTLMVYPPSDTRIFVSSLNKTFLLNNYELDKVGCPCNGGKKQVARAVSVNGVRREGNHIIMD